MVPTLHPTYGFARSIRCAGDGVGSWELSGGRLGQTLLVLG